MRKYIQFLSPGGIKQLKNYIAGCEKQIVYIRFTNRIGILRLFLKENSIGWHAVSFAKAHTISKSYL
jgi:hypothetical protein